MDEISPTETMKSQSYWLKFSTIYVSGVLAAASIGKVGPISTALRRDLRLSLDQVGLVASSVTATAAVLGILVGVGTRRSAKKPLLIGGLAVMAVAGLVASRTQSFGPLIAARLAESAGYVVVVVAAPILVMSLDEGARRTVALAIWGTFLPVGLALGSFAGGILSTWWGWRVWLGLAAAAIAAMALITGMAVPRGDLASSQTATHTASGRHRLRRLVRPLSLSVGFATASATIVALVTLFPTYLTEVFDIPTDEAGTITGAVSLIGVTGGFTASWLLHRGVRVSVIFLAGVLMPVGAIVAFTQLGDVALSISGAVVVALANELVVAAVFAAVPLVARTSEDISTANGLIAQLGSLGSLAGPPLAGLLVVTAGAWWPIGLATLAVCLLGVALLRFSVRTSPE